MLVTYDDVLRAAEGAKVHEQGYKYVLVILHDGDTSENPASTKEHRRLEGPAVWVWQIHPSGVTVHEFEGEVHVPTILIDGAAVIDTNVVSSHYTEPRS